MVSRLLGMKRLVKLWNLLQTVPPEKFKMARWAMPTEGVELYKKYRMNGCGTSACVAGWATRVVPDLKLEFYSSVWGFVEARVVSSESPSTGLDAFAESFGLTKDEESEDICLPGRNHARLPKIAARAVMRQIETMAEELGYEVLDV